jgi:glucose/arabinose dehydrogenase
VSFGPDGYLYVAFGDGGSAGDPLGHGQNRMTLLGALLRLDVNGGAPYAIPPGNPFANGVQGRPEIWAYGLRNPWRFAHDPEDGLLYIADVGQGAREEVNIVSDGAAGLNYGWDVMEGNGCFQAAACDMAGLTLPELVYPHGGGSGRGCSVTGGVVYRGAAIPDLDGWYLYGDFCEGWVRALRFAGGDVAYEGEIVPPGLGGITSFGTVGGGVAYVLLQDGGIYRYIAKNDGP